jgi:hypothetical protein
VRPSHRVLLVNVTLCNLIFKLPGVVSKSKVATGRLEVSLHTVYLINDGFTRVPQFTKFTTGNGLADFNFSPICIPTTNFGTKIDFIKNIKSCSHSGLCLMLKTLEVNGLPILIICSIKNVLFLT